VVTWEAGGSSSSVVGQRYDASGQPVGAQLDYALFSGVQGNAQVALTGDGRVLIAWTSQDSQDGDADGIFAQRYDAQGALLGSIPW
jgi:hypothetical protein